MTIPPDFPWRIGMRVLDADVPERRGVVTNVRGSWIDVVWRGEDSPGSTFDSDSPLTALRVDRSGWPNARPKEQR